MKVFITAVVFGLSFLTFGQNEMFQQKMGEALQKYSMCESAEAYIQSAMNFEEIAQVETENWLPEYYRSISYVMASFNLAQPQAAQKDVYLDKAESSLAKLKRMVPMESEVFALESMFYTARLSVNPMERGQKYSGLSMQSVEKALAMDKTNPRAKYMKLANEMGIAQFFGKDLTPFCAQASTLLAEWDNYKVKSVFHPNWGKPQVQGVLSNCASKEDKGSLDSKEDEKEGNTLQITVKNLKSSDGKVLLQLKNENEEVLQSITGKIENGESILQFSNLPNGSYSVSFFHDANSNMKLDSGKYGPTEGYGFSNNAKGFMSAPKFNKTLFLLDKDLILTLKTRN